MFNLKSYLKSHPEVMKGLKIVSVASCVLYMSYAGVSTYQTANGEPQYNASEFIPKGSKKLFQMSSDSVKKSARQNHNMVAKQNQRHQNYIHQGMRKTPYEQKRLSMVAHYINTNDKTHGLKYAKYNPNTNQLMIVFNHNRTNLSQQNYANHLIKEFNAD